MARLVMLLLLVLAPWAARAAVDPADQPAAVCEWAALTAAAEVGVPPDILATLTLTETGRRRAGVVRPWAWSVNAEGAGSWFNDPAEALAFAQDRIDQGRLNLDIGCFQLNYRWHGENFPSVVEMFDPLENARYAARFVRDLYAETGDWRRAAGAFHSRTAVNATKYLPGSTSCGRRSCSAGSTAWWGRPRPTTASPSPVPWTPARWPAPASA